MIKTDPPAGGEVGPNTRITVTVSKGPAPIKVPNVVGKNVDQAKRDLEKLKLKVKIEEREDDKPAGTVVAQNPDEGSGAEEGAEVTLTVSKGPPVVVVPEVRGQPAQEAKQILEGAGFKVRVFGNENGRVIIQDPGAGGQLPQGHGDPDPVRIRGAAGRRARHRRRRPREGCHRVPRRHVGERGVQVYVSNPRGWARPDGSPEQDEAFRALCAERDVVAWVHACLLVNLGSPTPATVEQSVATLRHALRRAGEIGARGVVFHAGSAVDGDPRTRRSDRVREVLLPDPRRARPRRARGCWSSPAPAAASAWRSASRTSARTSTRSAGTRCSASASTPVTPGPPATT